MLLSNPLLDFEQLLFVKRNGPRNGLPANWQSNSQIRAKSFDDSIDVLALADSAGAVLENDVVALVTENGLTAFPCEQMEGTAVLRLDAIESGRVFVLRSGEAR